MRGGGVCLEKLELVHPGVCSTECAISASVAETREAKVRPVRRAYRFQTFRLVEGELLELVDVDEEVAGVRLHEDVEEERWSCRERDVVQEECAHVCGLGEMGEADVVDA